MITFNISEIDYLDRTKVLVGISSCGCITSVSHPRNKDDVIDFSTRMEKTGRTVDYIPKKEAMDGMFTECNHRTSY